MPVCLTALVYLWYQRRPVAIGSTPCSSFRVAIGLRLGTALCETHQCPCGALIGINCLHELSCKSNSGKNAGHFNISDLVCHVLKRAEIHAIVELTGLLRSDGKRPNRLALIHWKAGKSAL